MSTPSPALDPSEVTVGINNGPGLYIASAGTEGPGLGVAWGSGWTPIGYVSTDGVTIGATTDSETLTPWQSVSPIRTLITGRSFTMQFVMWQTNRRNMSLYFDTPLPTSDSFDVRSDQGGYLYAIGVDVLDGENSFQIVFPRAQISDNGDVPIQRGDAVGWDVTLSALDDNGVLAHVEMGEVTGRSGGSRAASSSKAA